MNRRRGGKAILILLLLLTIVVIAAVGAYIYLATDVFKTPEQLFKKYMLTGILEMSQTEFKPFDEVTERSQTEPTECSVDVTLDTGSIMGTSENAIKYDVNLRLATDYPNKKDSLNLLINKNNEEYLKGTIALTDQTLGISVPDLHDKYIAVENRDLKKLAKTFEVPDEVIEYIPDSIPEFTPLTEEEEKTLNSIITRYFEKITGTVDETSYLAEKKVDVTIDGQLVKADKYTLTVGSKHMYTTVTTLIKEILEDQEVLELCQGRIDTKYIDEFKKMYNDALAEMSADDIKDFNIQFVVYAAKGKNIKTEMLIEDQKLEMMLKNSKDGVTTMTLITTQPKNDTNDVGVTTTVTYTNTYANNIGELVYEQKVEYNQADIAALEAEQEANSNSYFSSFYNIDYAERYANTSNKYIIRSNKVDDNTITAEVLFEGDDFQNVKDILKVNLTYKFGNAVTIDTITSDNSIIINDYTMTDFTNLLMEFTTNGTAIAQEKPDTFIGSLFKNMMPSVPDSTEDDDYYSSFDDPDWTYPDDDYSYDSDFDTEDDSSSNVTYEDIMNDFDSTTDNSSTDDYYHVVSEETLRTNIDAAITKGLDDSLAEYKTELYYNSEANLGDFLTVENVQKSCGSEYRLELLDGTTMKCTVKNGPSDYVFYALMYIDGVELIVTDVEVLTEEEYLNR